MIAVYPSTFPTAVTSPKTLVCRGVMYVYGMYIFLMSYANIAGGCHFTCIIPKISDDCKMPQIVPVVLLLCLFTSKRSGANLVNICDSFPCDS